MGRGVQWSGVGSRKGGCLLATCSRAVREEERLVEGCNKFANPNLFSLQPVF